MNTQFYITIWIIIPRVLSNSFVIFIFHPATYLLLSGKITLIWRGRYWLNKMSINQWQWYFDQIFLRPPPSAYGFTYNALQYLTRKEFLRVSLPSHLKIFVKFQNSSTNPNHHHHFLNQCHLPLISKNHFNCLIHLSTFPRFCSNLIRTLWVKLKRKLKIRPLIKIIYLYEFKMWDVNKIYIKSGYILLKIFDST